MITVVAKNYIQEGKTEDFLQLAKKLVEATNNKDEGCISYQLYADQNNPLVFTFIEQWQDQNALDKHFAAAHFKDIVPKLGTFAQKEGEVSLYKKVD